MLSMRILTRLREMLESDEADMRDGLTSLLTLAHANRLNPCLDAVGDATLPVSLQGEVPSIGDAWLQYQRKHKQKIETEERAFALEWRLKPLTEAPECNTIGYARAELGVAQRPAQSSTTTTLATGSFLSMAPATLPPTLTCISPVIPTALFEVTDRTIINETKKLKSPFIPNSGKLEDGMQLGIHSWAAFTEKSSVDHRAFFVSRNPAYVPKAMGGGLHVLDYGEVMIEGRDLESRFTFPKPGTAGAVVYEEREAGLLRHVAICVGVFSLPAHEEETCLIPPLSDVVPHLAVVQQRLLFSCYNN